MVKNEEKSYIEMCLTLEGADPVYLRIPSLWDAVEVRWIGFVQTPETKRIISAFGKDSFELQNNFNIAFLKLGLDEEVFSMFKPKEYWESLSE